jgi:hypothetical protein
MSKNEVIYRKKLVIGEFPDGSGAVAVDIRLYQNRNRRSIDLTQADAPGLWIMGGMPPSRNDGWQYGKIADHIRSMVEQNKLLLDVPRADVERLLNVWDRWDGNGQRRITRVQHDYLKARGIEYSYADHDKVCTLLRQAGLEADRGFFPGSDTLIEPLPADVLEFLYAVSNSPDMLAREAELDEYGPCIVDMEGIELHLEPVADEGSAYKVRASFDGLDALEFKCIVRTEGSEPTRRDLIYSFHCAVSDIEAYSEADFDEFLDAEGISWETHSDAEIAKAQNSFNRVKGYVEAFNESDWDWETVVYWANILNNFQAVDYSGLKVSDAPTLDHKMK